MRRALIAIIICITLFAVMFFIPTLLIYRTEMNIMEASNMVAEENFEGAKEQIDVLKEGWMIDYDRTNLMLLELLVDYSLSAREGEMDEDLLEGINVLKDRDLMEEQKSTLNLIELSVKSVLRPEEAVLLAREIESSSTADEIVNTAMLIELFCMVSLESLSEKDIVRVETLLQDEELEEWLSLEMNPMVEELIKLRKYWPIIKFTHGYFNVRDLPLILNSFVRLIIDRLMGVVNEGLRNVPLNSG